MKTVFRISPKFPVRAGLAKLAARFCLRLARRNMVYGLQVPKQITFTMFGGNNWWRSGRADQNTGRAIANNNRNVFVRVKQNEQAYTERYHRYHDSPVCRVEGTIEMYVHLIAHELGHAVCGFSGDKTGEFRCELFAAECLEAWRLAMQPNANMI